MKAQNNHLPRYIHIVLGTKSEFLTIHCRNVKRDFTFAFVLLFARRRSPGQIVVVRQTVFAVVAHRVVGAVTLAVDHAHDVLK